MHSHFTHHPNTATIYLKSIICLKYEFDIFAKDKIQA